MKTAKKRLPTPGDLWEYTYLNRIKEYWFILSIKDMDGCILNLETGQAVKLREINRISEALTWNLVT